MMRSHGRYAGLWLLSIFIPLAWIPTVSALPLHDELVGQLASLERMDMRSGCRLEVRRESPDGAVLQTQQELELRITTSKPCWLILLRVDAHGVVDVAGPSLGIAGNLASP